MRKFLAREDVKKREVYLVAATHNGRPGCPPPVARRADEKRSGELRPILSTLKCCRFDDDLDLSQPSCPVQERCRSERNGRSDAGRVRPDPARQGALRRRG